MTPDLILGVDPGINGGIALLTQQGEIVGVWPAPPTEHETVELVSEFAPRISKAIIERLGPMGSMTSKVTMFKLGQSYGFLRGVLVVLQIPFDEIQPKAWQKSLQCIYPKSAKYADRKAINRQKAQQLFARVQLSKTEWAQLSDALLLAEYGRRSTG